jgi:hypothetical protein
VLFVFIFNYKDLCQETNLGWIFPSITVSKIWGIEYTHILIKTHDASGGGLPDILIWKFWRNTIA